MRSLLAQSHHGFRMKETELLAASRDPGLGLGIMAELKRTATRPWRIMEVCGGQTHALIASGIDQALPAGIVMIHGPGCPVCVTPVETIDRAVALARRPEVVLASFGDMLRVPGSGEDLLSARAAGGDVRVVYSPLEAVEMAEREPDRQVVFFAIGFETTAPANAMAVLAARERGIGNFSLLVSQVMVPPVLAALTAAGDVEVDGFLAAGHVCTVTGLSAYEEFAAEHRKPVVATGLEPNDILEGILILVRMLEQGRCGVVNQYSRSVRPEGNPRAMAAVARVFEPVDQKWRGIGEIPASGLGLRPEFSWFDAVERFSLEALRAEESGECRSGEVLKGLLRPDQCPAFAVSCTPETPLGATMVSSEGACAAYYHYRRS